MKIFGKSLADYIRFERGFLILVLVVGVARFLASALGVPNSIVRLLSLTGLFLLGMVYYAVRVHTSGFGSYRHLLPIYALPVILGNCIIIAGIVIAILTGTNNIYSEEGGSNWGHVAGHVIAMIVLPLILWGLGSLVMLAARKLTTTRVQGA